jgi:hypothetical protein
VSADQIAKVMSDLTAGRCRWTDGYIAELSPRVEWTSNVVVDVQAIYEQVAVADKNWSPYEDFLLAPPWMDAVFGYVNQHGNTMVASFNVFGPDEVVQWQPSASHPGLDLPPDHSIDWDDVKWVLVLALYIGGHSIHTGGTIPTTGPIFAWKFAVDGQGKPLDMVWQQMTDMFTQEDLWCEVLTFLSALNFLNCRNVQIVEPHRSRAERRRLERHGVTISEINITPIGKSYRYKRGQTETGSVPLTSVRGHFASYGPEYGRKLLFGKYAGRFWIPVHARGAREAGETTQHFTLETA